MDILEIALLFAIRLLGLVYTRVVVDLSSSCWVSYRLLFAHGIRRGWGIPAYAGMTWEGAGMMRTDGGMTWVGVGMMRTDGGMTWVGVGMTRVGGG